MRGGIPNRPTGFGKWAAFDQAVWDKLWGAGADKWHDSPTVKVQETSIGRWLNAKLNPANPQPNEPNPGFYLLAYIQNVPSPYALSDYNNTLSAVLAGIASVNIRAGSAVHHWINNINGDTNYWANFTNSGLPTPNDMALPKLPPWYWETYNDGQCALDYGDNWCNRSSFPFASLGGSVYTLPSGGVGIGMLAGVTVQGNGIGSTGIISASKWVVKGYSPSSFGVSLIHAQTGYPSASPPPLSLFSLQDAINDANNVLESTTTLTPTGTTTAGKIYELNGVSSLGPLSIPNSTHPFQIRRGYWAYTEGFSGSLSLPSDVDPTVTVTSNPSNASCVHNSTSAVFTCAGTIPGGLGYTLGYLWCFSTDGGVNWAPFGSDAAGITTNTLTYTPTTTGTTLNGALVKCQLYTNAGMNSTNTAILSVT